jgi:ferredoxin
MLDQAFFVEDNSRLGCQLHLTLELDGLEIVLAPESDV